MHTLWHQTRRCIRSKRIACQSTTNSSRLQCTASVSSQTIKAMSLTVMLSILANYLPCILPFSFFTRVRLLLSPHRLPIIEAGFIQYAAAGDAAALHCGDYLAKKGKCCWRGWITSHCLRHCFGCLGTDRCGALKSAGVGCSRAVVGLH